MSTHICKNIDRSKLGRSFYQVTCKKHYDELRDIHTQVFLNAKRIEVEKTKKRYRFGNVQGVRNLYTFINLLAELLKDKKNVKGIDYSCAAHFFVNDAVCRFKWNVTDYDIDMCAIEDAWRRYPESRNHYQQWNLLEENIPEKDQ